MASFEYKRNQVVQKYNNRAAVVINSNGNEGFVAVINSRQIKSWEG
jgi:hypothetical protein